jgi:hypothetical protein
MQVATVRHKASVFVKSQIARMEAMTLIAMQIANTVNEITRMILRLMKPLFCGRAGGSGEVSIGIF